MENAINQKVFSEMVNEAIKIKKSNHDISTVKVAEDIVESYSQKIDITENQKNDLVFQITYAIINSNR